MMSVACYTVLGLWYMVAMVSGCSIDPNTVLKEYSFEQTLDLAPIVVSGKDVYHAPVLNGPRNYTFDVYCVFKNNDISIPSTIFLLNVGAITCDGSDMEEGREYIAGLKKASKSDLDLFVSEGNKNYFDNDSDLYYVMAEPETWASAAFDASASNLNTTAQLCGVNDDIKVLDRQGDDGHTCPKRVVDSNTCIMASGANRQIAHGISILWIIIMYFL